MNKNTYTKEGVEKALNTLNRKLDNKILERKGINEEIRSIKKNIKLYQELDLRQLKIADSES